MTDQAASTAPDIPSKVIDLIGGAEWITVFSGAGMSAESGIGTFRDAQTGLWERFDPTQLASPEGWDDDPDLVWGWYQWRARQVRDAAPNAGHHALAELGRSRSVMIVTQNVDDLHERAGSGSVCHLHGSLFAPRCSRCGAPYEGRDADPSGATGEPMEPPTCPVCLSAIRPGVVWFGENLPADAWTAAESAIRGAQVVVVIGTSGVVYPAAALPERAAAAGIPVIECNPEPSALTPITTASLRISAAVGIPAMVRAVLDR